MAPSQDCASPLAGRVLPALLLLSGFCGISYEILYAKLLGNLLGSQFTINGTVLLTFLAGIGLGTLYAHRFVKYLPAIEASIGIYAALMAVLYDILDRFLYATVPFLGTNIYAAALVSFALLAVPAFLVGCSVPIFAGYLSTLRTERIFSITYGLYNVGAGLTALAMEFILLRTVGVRAATVILAILNGVVAGGLILLLRNAPLVPSRPKERIEFALPVIVALALASIASAVFQLLIIKVAEFIFGPYNETFALVLATVLFGLAVGSLASGRLGLTFRGALILSLGGLVWILTILPASVHAYAFMYPHAVGTYALLVLLKFGLVVFLMGVPAVGFGATIPALLKTHKNVAQESGQLLFVSSMANALGFLLMAFVLHQYLDYGPIIIVIAALTAAAILVHAGRQGKVGWLAAGLAVLSILAYRGFWDETLLYVGHKTFHSLEELEKEKSSRLYADRFKGPQDVFAITWKDGKPYFFINGYISIALESSAETLVGAVASILAPRTDEALVLGVGSGATAGSVGLLFEHTDAVEINRVVLQNLHRMSKYNHGIEANPRVSIIHDDGIHFIKTTKKRYSLILNTVTTPLYFSSSKLYTKDFFEHVNAHLKPDGIYTTWIDGRIGDYGVNIILETLADSFKHSWIYFVRSSYFIVACSNGEMGFGDLDALKNNAQLERFFEVEHLIPLRILPYSVFSTNAVAFKSPDAVPINTLDFPVLEFAMARLPTDHLKAFKGRLSAMDLGAVRDAASRAMDWRPAEFLFFMDYRLREKTRLYKAMKRALEREFGDVGREYGEAVVRFAEDIGTAAAYRKFGEKLFDQKDFRAAARCFSKGIDLDPTLKDAHYFLGRCYQKNDEYERALLYYEREWELTRHGDAPMRAAKVLLKLGRCQEALQWLDVAADIGVKKERVFYYRGRGYECLGSRREARLQYEEALKASPGSKRARKGLLRLRGE